MPWDDEAEAALMNVPPAFRTLVIDNTERAAREKGLDAVSFTFFGDLAREYGMDKEFIGRFSKS